jgi:hypothetical protein
MANLILNGSTSGSVTLSSPAVSGTTTLTLPTTTGTLVVTSGAQTIEFADGSASTPSITNSGNTNTGIFFSAADTIDFAEGGVACGQFDSSGNFKFNSGYGSVATAYGCRAWVNFDGTTNTGGLCTIRASAGVTSVSDNGTGLYTINLSITLPDANYCVIGTSSANSATSPRITSVANYSAAQTTTSVRFVIQADNGSVQDSGQVCVAIFR